MFGVCFRKVVCACSQPYFLNESLSLHLVILGKVVSSALNLGICLLHGSVRQMKVCLDKNCGVVIPSEEISSYKAVLTCCGKSWRIVLKIIIGEDRWETFVFLLIKVVQSVMLNKRNLMLSTVSVVPSSIVC